MNAASRGEAFVVALTDAQAAEQRVQLAPWASGERVWAGVAGINRMTVDRAETDEPALPGFVDGLTLEQFLDRAHPDDAPSVRLVGQLHWCGAHPDIDVSFRLDDADGHQRWLRVRGRALKRHLARRARVAGRQRAGAGGGVDHRGGGQRRPAPLFSGGAARPA